MVNPANRRANQTAVNLTKCAALAAVLGGAMAVQAQPDYGPAIWRQAYAGHWYTSGNGHHFCVIHDMEGYYLSTISYIQGGGGPDKVSIYYCVNGVKDSSSDAPAGEITQMVREANYAWHAGCWNTWMFGTEHEGFASNPAWYTEALYQASAGLQQHLCAVGAIPKDRNHIIAHGEGQNAAWRSWMAANWPGVNTTCNSHTDPGPYWDWNHFMALMNPASLHLDVFVRGSDNGLWHKWFDTVGWQPGQTTYDNYGGALASDPAAVCWAFGRIDAFYKGADSTLQHKFYTGTWSGPETLGGVLTGKPAASSLGSGKLDVFVRGTDNALWHKWYDVSSGWHPSATTFENLGGTMASDPAAVSWSNNRIDVFYKGTDGTLQHRFWTPTGWSGVESLGGGLTGAPAVTSWAAGRLDVFIRGTDNVLWHKLYAGTWSAWESLGGTLAADPGAVSGGLNRIDVFMKGTDSAMWHKYYDGTWHPNESLGGVLSGAPAAASWTHTN